MTSVHFSETSVRTTPETLTSYLKLVTVLTLLNVKDNVGYCVVQLTRSCLPYSILSSGLFFLNVVRPFIYHVNRCRPNSKEEFSSLSLQILYTEDKTYNQLNWYRVYHTLIVKDHLQVSRSQLRENYRPQSPTGTRYNISPKTSSTRYWLLTSVPKPGAKTRHGPLDMVTLKGKYFRTTYTLTLPLQL